MGVKFLNSEDYSEINKKESPYAIHFDTIKMLMGKLWYGYENGTEYPIKGDDINALMLIDKYPKEQMHFYSSRVNLKNGSFTYVANKLEKLELIEIIVCEDDKRKKEIILTEKGNIEVNRLRKKLNEHIEVRLSCLDENDKIKFLNSMDILREIAFKINKKEC